MRILSFEKFLSLSYKERNNLTGIVESSKFSHRYYLVNGLAHRLDGPAIEYSSGHKEWCLYGKVIKVSSQEEFERYLVTLAFE